jgi:hypothetical protein
MAMKSEKPNNIKQIQLPSGKVIDVLCFTGQPECDGHEAIGHDQPQTAALPGAENTGLHICGRCSGDLVYPVDWAEAGDSHWEVSLRCPDCEWSDSGVFSQDVVERFDIELDRGAEVLLRDLQHLAHANMADDIERFIAAVHADLIVPADF